MSRWVLFSISLLLLACCPVVDENTGTAETDTNETDTEVPEGDTSGLLDDTPPIIQSITHSPITPRAQEEVTIHVVANDDESSISISYDADRDGTFNNSSVVVFEEAGDHAVVVKAESEGGSATDIHNILVGQSIPEGSSAVSFSYVPSQQSKAITDLNADPNELFVIDIFSQEIQVLPLYSGINEIILERDSQHLIGMIYNSVHVAKSITGLITSLGNINIVTLGLDSLPISDDASDEIDLESVEFDDSTGFSTDVDAEVISEEVGLDAQTLTQFGGLDNVVRNVLNPDINRNGTYDYEEGIYWSLRLYYYIENPITPSDYESRNYTPPDELNYYALVYYFFSNLESDHIPYLQLPETIEVYDQDNERVHSIETADTEYGLDHGVFSITNLVPIGPYNGDYVIRAGDISLYLDNLEFYSRFVDIQGFFIPFATSYFDPDLQSQSVVWRWQQIHDGEYTEIDTELFPLIIRSFGLEIDGFDEVPEFLLVEEWLAGEFTFETSEKSINFILSYDDNTGNRYKWFFRNY